MIKLGIASAIAVAEPRATATAATDFPGFRDDAAFGTCGTDGRCRACSRVYVDISQNMNTKKWKHENSRSMAGERIYLPDIGLRLTFANLDAIKPPVISVTVAGTSTILIPTTTRSAATGSA